MALIAFQDLLTRAVRKCGLDPFNLSQALADNFADWLQERVLRAWIISTWPDTMSLEQRQFQPTWTAQNYTSGAGVWYAPGLAYYQANGNTGSGDVPGTSPLWTLYGPAKWIPFAQVGQTIISEPLNVWRDDPRMVRGPRKVSFWHDSQTVFLDPKAHTSQPWIQFRRVSPQFVATAYDATVVYPVDSLFLWTDRNVYLVLATTTAGDTPATAGAKFAAQQCPAVLADYAIRAAKADWLSDDGQDDKSAEAETLAQGWLMDRLADLTILQGQTAGYGAP